MTSKIIDPKRVCGYIMVKQYIDSNSVSRRTVVQSVGAVGILTPSSSLLSADYNPRQGAAELDASSIEARFDNINEDRELVVPAQEDAVISGAISVDPGKSIGVGVDVFEDTTFSYVNVREDHTFEAPFNFADVDLGDKFTTFIIISGNRVKSIDSVVVESPTQPSDNLVDDSQNEQTNNVNENEDAENESPLDEEGITAILGLGVSVTLVFLVANKIESNPKRDTKPTSQANDEDQAPPSNTEIHLLKCPNCGETYSPDTDFVGSLCTICENGYLTPGGEDISIDQLNND